MSKGGSYAKLDALPCGCLTADGMSDSEAFYSP